ncbi:Fungal specific transcription factor domain containing protein [Naviculisporaceae sp. PSN 640]
MDPANSANQPAGYFSTFSVLDFNGNTKEGPVRVQKRNRRVFVCIPCHQRKLKCDKGRPCSRCVRSGAADECVYQPLQSSQKSRQGSASSGLEVEGPLKPASSPGSSCSESRVRLHGITHWKSIASEFGEAWPYIMGSDPEWQPRYRQLEDLSCLFSSLPGMAYPLGDTCQYSRERDQVISTFPSRKLVETLAQCYFAAFEPTHRLINQQEFAYELNSFWMDHTQTSDVWLTQLCMMLALGCRAAPNEVFRGSGRSAEDWTDTLLDSAQYFYGGRLSSLTPTLTTMRSLCLLIIARTMDIVKGSTVAQLESLMGMTVRLAMTMHLHRSTTLVPEIGVFEAEMRKRVWVTIQILDLDIAMRTGTSYICRDHDADPPLNIDDTAISFTSRGWTLGTTRCAPVGNYTDSSFQIMLSDILPLLAEIINAINSPTQQKIEQTRLAAWASQLQQKLKEVEDELTNGQHRRPQKCDKITIQRQFLNVLVHRTLMAMNHESVTTTRGSQKSVRTVVRSAVSLLRIQMAWYSTPRKPRNIHQYQHTGLNIHSRSPSPLLAAANIMQPNKSSWLVNMCHDDFTAAVLYLMIALRTHNIDSLQSDYGGPGAIPSRTEIWSIIRQSLNISGDQARQSMCQFRAFMCLSIAAACLQSIDTGEPLMPLLQDAAAEVERRVLFSTGGGGNGPHEEEQVIDMVGLGLSHDNPPTSHHLWSAAAAPDHAATITASNGHPHQQNLAPVSMDFPAGFFEFPFG